MNIIKKDNIKFGIKFVALASLVTGASMWGYNIRINSIENIREEGKRQGIEFATSNLVSAVEAMTRFSKDNLNYRALGAFDNPGLNDQQKLAYGEACFHGIRHLDRLNELIRTDSKEIANGKKTAEDSLKGFIEFESKLTSGEYK